jgi:hypothetical protein
MKKNVKYKGIGVKILKNYSKNKLDIPLQPKYNGSVEND